MKLSDIQQFIPFLIPVVIIQFILMIAGIIDLVRREKTRGPKWVWVIVIVFVNMIGPIIYFIFGRKEE
jgi:Phospholipase_D-nuclease N-terminal